MKNRFVTRIILALLAVVLCASTLTSALAGTSTENGGAQAGGGAYWQAELNALPPFKFEIHKGGIGYGKCPIYSAPSMDAYRCANGKAVCQTSGYRVDDAGYVSGWLLVRYETNAGNYRVGYIPPKYIKGFNSKMYPHFGYIPAKADSTIYVTDNPFSHIGSFAMLSAGEEFHILSKYNYYANDGYEWYYIQCNVDGQPACGFIEMTSSFHLGD